jgi:hypothetical protein
VDDAPALDERLASNRFFYVTNPVGPSLASFSGVSHKLALVVGKPLGARDDIRAEQAVASVISHCSSGPAEIAATLRRGSRVSGA